MSKIINTGYGIRVTGYGLHYPSPVTRNPKYGLRYPLSVTRNPKYGFTLIELMLVIIIIGTLAAMVMPRLVGRTEQAKVATAEADINSNIATALKLYEVDNGSFPTTEEGLDALLNKPAAASRWNGPYLEREPIDPWGEKYQYKSPGQNRPYDYDLYSLGKDGKEGQDDIKNWK